MEVTFPANTASASARASAGDPWGAHEQAWAGFGSANAVSRHIADPTARAQPTRLPPFSGKETPRVSRLERYWANRPPSITNSLPVMKDDSSDARNSTP